MPLLPHDTWQNLKLAGVIITAALLAVFLLWLLFSGEESEKVSRLQPSVRQAHQAQHGTAFLSAWPVHITWSALRTCIRLQVSPTEGIGFVHPPLNARYARAHMHGNQLSNDAVSAMLLQTTDQI